MDYMMKSKNFNKKNDLESVVDLRLNARAYSVSFFFRSSFENALEQLKDQIGQLREECPETEEETATTP